MDRLDSIVGALWQELAGEVAGLHVRGRYLRSPLRGSAYGAELGCVPMQDPEDYAQATLFEWPSEVPVLMSPGQRSRLIGSVVDALRRQLPSVSLFVVQMVGPDFDVPLPASLLAADVMIVHEPLPLAHESLAAGRRNVVVLRQDLRADSIEPGHNGLELLLLRPDPAADTVRALLALLQDDAALAALHGLSVQRLDASAVERALQACEGALP